jgi:hypothetical protein
VKPQNILVLPTSYVLADFGIARMADAANTSSLQLVSYRHAAPQMLDGAEPSPADDLWSLGSTLYTLLDGAPPFATDDDTVLSYLARVRSTEPRPLSRPDVPPELAAILSRCLSKRREDRFPDAASLRAALAAVDTRGWTPAAPIADFGPRPAAPLSEIPPEIPPDVPDPTERDLTVAGPGSALAGLTVRLPDAPQPPPAVTPPPAPEPEPAPPRRRRKGLLLGLAAVLVGVTAGVLATVLSGPDGQTAQPPAGTTPTAATTTTATTTTTTPPATGGNPAFAPVLAPLDDQGESVTLTWTDPTGGNAEFVVVDATAEQGQAITQLPAGATTYRVEGLDPAVEQYCFVVLAIGLDNPAEDKGASERLCTNR